MQKLNFDLGFKEYEIGGGVLRFNPSDPNVYSRFIEARDKFFEIERQLVKKAEAVETTETDEQMGEVALKLLNEADNEAKKILEWIFGPQNDIDAIFCGCSIYAVGAHNERNITNFIHAVQPVLEKGARKCVQQQVDQAKMNRAQRRAAAKKK